MLPGVSGGCGDVYFYYVGADDRSAVTIRSELSNRSARENTVIEVTLPSRQVEVRFQQGTDLRRPQCNDVGRAQVEHEVAVVEGTVVITVDPRIRGGGLVEGSARLTGAVTEDGTPLPDLQMSSDQIGFTAG